MTNPERPSRHGVILGEALSAMAEAGGGCGDACATCAFRLGCMTNQMAATGMTALNCVLNIDPDEFGCHHGMSNGQPTRLCAGYEAAQRAPFSAVRAIMAHMQKRLGEMSGPDEVRAAFDAWRDEIDPDHSLDNYQLARAYMRRPVTGDLTPSTAGKSPLEGDLNPNPPVNP